jgi:hypothetical protein
MTRGTICQLKENFESYSLNNKGKNSQLNNKSKFKSNTSLIIGFNVYNTCKSAKNT